jgi:hypothetical protein
MYVFKKISLIFIGSIIKNKEFSQILLDMLFV